MKAYYADAKNQGNRESDMDKNERVHREALEKGAQKTPDITTTTDSINQQ